MPRWSKLRIYTARQFQAADPLDRLYMHWMEPERWKLREDEQLKLQKLRTAWALICKKSRPMERTKAIIEAFDCSERQAQRYLKEAVSLFVDTLEFDYDLELRLAYERYMQIFNKAKNDNDWDSARRAQDSAIKLMEQINSRAPKQGKVYAEITFTDNPAALEPSNAEELEFEDISYEEGGLLEPEAARISEGDQAL